VIGLTTATNSVEPMIDQMTGKVTSPMVRVRESGTGKALL